MRLMHTPLPDFYEKLKNAAKRLRPETEVSIRGLENIKTAKLASLRVGRVENEILELTQDPEVAKIEVVLMDRLPETARTVVVKSYDKNGVGKKAILENIYLTIPAVDCEVEDMQEVEDRRGALAVADPV